jgi:hypothetical protein
VDFVGDVEQVKAGYWPRHVIPLQRLDLRKVGDIPHSDIAKGDRMDWLTACSPRRVTMPSASSWIGAYLLSEESIFPANRRIF